MDGKIGAVEEEAREIVFKIWDDVRCLNSHQQSEQSTPPGVYVPALKLRPRCTAITLSANRQALQPLIKLWLPESDSTQAGLILIIHDWSGETKRKSSAIVILRNLPIRVISKSA